MSFPASAGKGWRSHPSHHPFWRGRL